MVKILFVNACCRGSDSRTLHLARILLEALQLRRPDAEIVTHDLYAAPMQPMNAELLAVREPLCNALDWDHPLTAPARQFQQADAVVIAAPYWDLSFPAVLKIWVENMWVRNLTFVYKSNLPVGLCRGKVCAYVTTSGSPIGKADFGTEYIHGVMQTLGIGGFLRISAEGLDIENAAVESIMKQGEQQAIHAAKTIEALLKTD